MKKTVFFNEQDIAAVRLIAHREGFIEVSSLLEGATNSIALDDREAQLLINIMVFEGYRHTLLYPYDSPQHPQFDNKHLDSQDAFFHGLYLRFTMGIEQSFDIVRAGKKV